jgi:hypothetical protein
VKNELSVDEIELKITKHQKKYSEERERGLSKGKQILKNSTQLTVA